MLDIAKESRKMVVLTLFGRFKNTPSRDLLSIFQENLKAIGEWGEESENIEIVRKINNDILYVCAKKRFIKDDHFPEIYQDSLMLFNERLKKYKKEQSSLRYYISKFKWFVVNDAYASAKKYLNLKYMDVPDIRFYEDSHTIDKETGEEKQIYDELVFQCRDTYEENLRRKFTRECIKELILQGKKKQVIFLILNSVSREYTIMKLAEKYKISKSAIWKAKDIANKSLFDCVGRKFKEARHER